MPKFTYCGEGEGTPIEDQSDLLLEAFYKAISDVTSPTTVIGTYKELSDTLTYLNEKLSTLETDLAKQEKALEEATGEDRKELNAEIQALSREIGNTRAAIDLTELAITHIYQVEVLRGTPLHAALMSDSFEFYPTGAGKAIPDMTDAELDAVVKRREVERNAFVSSMILSPTFVLERRRQTRSVCSGGYRRRHDADALQRSLCRECAGRRCFTASAISPSGFSLKMARIKHLVCLLSLKRAVFYHPRGSVRTRTSISRKALTD